jgi:hypothetical protein
LGKIDICAIHFANLPIAGEAQPICAHFDLYCRNAPTPA